MSIRAAFSIIRALQISLRAEASSLNVRKAGSGRPSRLVSESTGISLIRIEDGSGTLVLESEASSLLDLPAQVFEDLVREAKREPDDHESVNVGIQRALLSLESLFRESSPIESIEFVDGNNRVGQVTAGTVARIRDTLIEASDDRKESSFRAIGRMLELDLVQRSFQVHTWNSSVTINYEDYFEAVVFDALKYFVAADFELTDDGRRALIALNAIDEVPESRFDEQKTILQIVTEQGVKPLDDFDSLGMSSLESSDLVTIEDFRAFIRALRREGL